MPTLETFLTGVGPEFDPEFVAKHMGTSEYNDLIDFVWQIEDLHPLVDAGMKPLRRNKLFKAIVGERAVREHFRPSHRNKLFKAILEECEARNQHGDGRITTAHAMQSVLGNDASSPEVLASERSTAYGEESASEIDSGSCTDNTIAELDQEDATTDTKVDDNGAAEKTVEASSVQTAGETRCPKCNRGMSREPECAKCSGTGCVKVGWARKTCDLCLSGKSLCDACVEDKVQQEKDRMQDKVMEREAKKQEVERQQRDEEKAKQDRKAKGKGKGKGGRSFQRFDDNGPPSEGFTIERATAADLKLMKKFWKDRGAAGDVFEAWSIDNPLRNYLFNERKRELQKELGREPDQLDGLHGSNPNNYLSIIGGGFRTDLRGKAVGQAFGDGEYFAKCPDVSVGYCNGGLYILVCKLLLGRESSTRENTDGDHIWVPSCNYYVMGSPKNVLPVFIVKFNSPRSYGRELKGAEFESALAQGVYTTKKEELRRELPPPRDCVMSRSHATQLWMGLMSALNTDEQLEKDVRSFLDKHAREYTAGMRVQIVRAHFKKAHCYLTTPIPKAVVYRLNKEDFQENGIRHRICIEDMNGSPEQQCPKWIASYCRGQNLRFTDPCYCRHNRRPTDFAKVTLEDLDLGGAKANEIMDKFMSTAPFHDGRPRVVSIRVIKNDKLSQCHDEFRKYLTTRHRQEPKVRELYHGTNNNILDTLYQHGLQPPSDMKPDDRCPVSGGKGLCTSLCNNDCTFCTEKHEWGRCHMYGLGIYLADLAQKSHRYCSQPKMVGGRRQYRMIVCSVLGQAFTIEGHLRGGDIMHDVTNVRNLLPEDVDALIDPCCKPCATSTYGVGCYIRGSGGDIWGRVVADEYTCWRLDSGRIAKKETEGWRWSWEPYTGEQESSSAAIDLPADKSDMIFVEGLDSNARPGYSVVNSEYIAYHPHQCLPKYEITYEL